MANKWLYLIVIQQWFGQGWEDVSKYDKSEYKDWKHDVKEYRRLGYPTRTVGRRELNEEARA